MTLSLTFDAVAEARPGSKWKARWDRSWPAYEEWLASTRLGSPDWVQFGRMFGAAEPEGWP